MATRRPVSVLIAALGGQGGGVLTEWLVGAAAHAGYPAQATSIPGVAQRTGATTYYVEIFPERMEAGPEPVFSLYPTPGDVDVIVASELLEAGRTIEMDYASPGRTTLVASTHRLFSIAEKSALGNGVYPREALEAAARALTRRFVGFDALAAARQHQSEVNALLLGALAATGALPMSAADFEAAIREGGVAVERNLRGLKAGQDLVAAGPPAAAAPVAERPWPAVKAERAAGLGARGPRFLALSARMEGEVPEALHPVLGEALARLIDYQDPGYAELYLERVRRVRALDPGSRLTGAFARRLAVWMTYEDAIRVADLKTRRARFVRIRRENAAPAGAVVVVTDYLKPDLDELYGILPAAVGGPIARWAERRWPAGRPTIGQRVRTTSVLGFLRVWLLARLRGLRPASLRRRRVFGVMGRWEDTVLAAAALDEALAVEVAELANVVKGYGEVRRRTSGALERFLDETVRPAIEADRRAGRGFAHATALMREGRHRLLADEHASETPPPADHPLPSGGPITPSPQGRGQGEGR
jgi:indolepyruvate ferredoxin oxidoreductase beta subunit